MLQEDSDLISEIRIILENTGVIEGELGQVEAYKLKQQEIADWLLDANEKVRTLQKCMAGLDKQIISEKRRVEESIEIRKHIFGDDENHS